ncbi:thiamine pyrophosphate-binding protein [Terricaulis silvestris]|uniref:Acetolactate synthase isozyme 3 large subunit n=1 Tax=Terricaulis silvestris TaxID=2686094 RepID=A0A6I6MKC0_9CAUL|nr:thiamine pyrophosphate-binding protein [Terricaulis silvestris]QGZ93658.1 Acetolactate synthase isozyme 3 large subunit [Terricaulis silvestris]
MKPVERLHETESEKVSDTVARVLEHLGVSTAFGVTSVHNIGILDAIGRRDRIRFVMSRGEMGAAHMADGYARASGKLGVVITSTGPAAANAAAGLLEATLASSPVLHITGQSSRAHIDRGTGAVHDVPNQLGMLRAVCKSAHRVESAETIAPTLLRAAADALTPPMGAVSVEIPIDIQRGAAFAPALQDELSIPTPRAAPADTIAACTDLIASAKRPLLWIGGGARHAGSAVRRLLDLGFCLITSWNGRGVVPEDDPRSLGALNGVLSPQVDAFCRSANLLLVAGSRLRHQQTRDMGLFLPSPLIQIDIDPSACNRTYRNELFACGDAELTLDALADALEDQLSVTPSFQREFAEMKRAAIDDLCKRQGSYASFPAQLRAVMPRDAVWARDMTMSNNAWGHHAFPVDGPRDSVFPVGGGIGVGLPLAIGAAASGRKTVLLSGDGGFFLNHGELWTAIQAGLDITLIVMNDRGYGVIKHLQNASHGGRHFYTDLVSPELEGLAALGGIPYRRVTQADRFGPTAAEMIAVRGPSLVEVDMQAVGPLPYKPLPQTRQREAH